jgi:hypothetical protein
LFAASAVATLLWPKTKGSDAIRPRLAERLLDNDREIAIELIIAKP